MTPQFNPVSDSPNVCVHCLKMIDQLSEYIPAHEMAYFRKSQKIPGQNSVIPQPALDALNGS